ncbi:MAG: hypothetical protein IJ419_06660 [Agathobacter sp.]|nr:hypothetical protein [Agathobacter sp.]
MALQNIPSGNATLTYANKTMSPENYYRQLLEKKQEDACEELEKAQNTPVQTGAEKYTQKQWNSFLKDYDELTERAREEMRIRHEKQYEEQLEREERARAAVMKDYLEAVNEAKRKRSKEMQEQLLEEEEE